MKTAADISRLLKASTTHHEALRIVAALDLPDCWIAAGFVRNLVWDHLHGISPPTPLNDIDVIYFAPEGTSPRAETEIEARLIPTDEIHDTLAHFRRVMEASRSGMVRRSFQAMQQASTMAS